MFISTFVGVSVLNLGVGFNVCVADKYIGAVVCDEVFITLQADNKKKMR